MSSIFHRYAAAGFLPYILPILPPSAELMAPGKLDSRRGKVPGKYLAHYGKWVGFKDWTSHVTTMADVERWATWPGCGLGLQCGRLIAVDVDVTDRSLAKQIHAIVTERLGTAPLRVGNPPKFLLLYRLDEGAAGIGKIRLPFSLEGSSGPQALEVLGEGRQFVAEGVHPKTGRPYTWVGKHPCDVGIEGLT